MAKRTCNNIKLTKRNVNSGKMDSCGVIIYDRHCNDSLPMVKMANDDHYKYQNTKSRMTILIINTMNLRILL